MTVKRRTRLVSLSVIALSSTQLAGMCVPFGPSGPFPCDMDRFGCDDGDSATFVVHGACDPELGPLTLTLGTGDDRFEAFDPRGWAPFERGPQGGQHALMAYRVHGVNLGESERLRLTFELYQRGEDCEEAAGSCAQKIGQRRLVRGGGAQPLVEVEAGVVEEAGIIVFLDWWGPVRFPATISLLVEDQCGRSVTAEETFDE